MPANSKVTLQGISSRHFFGNLWQPGCKVEEKNTIVHPDVEQIVRSDQRKILSGAVAGETDLRSGRVTFRVGERTYGTHKGRDRNGSFEALYPQSGPGLKGLNANQYNTLIAMFRTFDGSMPNTRSDEWKQFAKTLHELADQDDARIAVATYAWASKPFDRTVEANMLGNREVAAQPVIAQRTHGASI